MCIAVHPSDENHVIIGGTDLFRSFDGFVTKPNDSKKHWIGGGKATADEPSPPYPAPTDTYFNHFFDQLVAYVIKQHILLRYHHVLCNTINLYK